MIENSNSPEINLFSLEQAYNITYSKLAKKAGITAPVIASTLKFFLDKIYNTGYALAQANQEAVAMLCKTEADRIFVGSYEIYRREYAEAFLLAQAEKFKLPVALIKSSFQELVKELYSEKYLFSGLISPEERLDIHKKVFIQDNKNACLTMKEKK